MTMLPQQRPAMFSWQQPLAALFGGLSAAGQPGGLANFGAGVNQTMQAQSQQAQQQQIAELRRMQIEQAQMEMNRANTEDAQRKATIERLRNLGGAGGATPVRPVGNYGAATGGAPQPSMFGGNPQAAMIYGGMLDAGNVEGALKFAADFAKPDEPGAPKTAGGMFWDGDSFEPIPGYTEQQAAIAAAGRTAAPAPATNLITLVAPDGKTTRSYDSRDPRVKQLAEDGWVERDRSLFPAPPIGYQPSAGGTGVEPIPGGPADPNRQTEAQRNEFKKQSLALDNLETALTAYETALDTYGSTEIYGAGRGVLENAYANVLIQAKEAAALGALTGPDMDIMNQTIIPPNSIGQLLAGGATGVKTQIGGFRGQLKQKRDNLEKLYSPRPPEDTNPDDPLGILD
jgi:hypothetical protein